MDTTEFTKKLLEWPEKNLQAALSEYSEDYSPEELVAIREQLQTRQKTSQVCEGAEASTSSAEQGAEGWSFLRAMSIAGIHYVFIIAGNPNTPPGDLFGGPILAGLVVGVADFIWKQANRERGQNRGCSWIIVLVAYLLLFQFFSRVQQGVLQKRHDKDMRVLQDQHDRLDSAQPKPR